MRQGVRAQGGGYIGAVCAVVCLVVGFSGFAGAVTQDVILSDIRNHGLYLDDKSKLKVEESDGWVTVYLQEKARAAGGPQVIYDEAVDEEIPVIRFGTERRLLRMRAEKLLPAEPNYVRNPGERYRVRIEGLVPELMYARVFEVDAAEALDAVGNEFKILQGMVHGVKQKAVYYGGLLSMRALNESGRLPAVIPVTILRSQVGEFRIQDVDYARGKVGSQVRFDEEEEGDPRFLRVMEEDASLNVRDVRAPSADLRRGMQENTSRGSKYVSRPYKSRRELEQVYRVNQVKGVQAKRDAPGAPVELGRRLTEPEEQYPPIGRAQIENYELLVGEFESAVDAKVRSR